jgi:hypothetical protein
VDNFFTGIYDRVIFITGILSQILRGNKKFVSPLWYNFRHKERITKWVTLKFLD